MFDPGGDQRLELEAGLNVSDAAAMGELRTVSPTGYLVQVRSGRHAGAELSLGAGTYLLGSGSDADIQLTDEGVAAGHVELRLGDGICRLWSLDGTVDLAGRHLAAGARGEAALPADIRVGGVDVTLVAPVAERVRSGGPSRRLMVVLVGLAVVGGAGLVVLSGAVPAFSTPRLMARVIGERPLEAGAAMLAPPSPELAPSAPIPVSATATPATTAPAGGLAAEAARALTARLGEDGLAAQVSVRGAGTVVEAAGAVAPERKEAWLRQQMWFDATYRGRLLLIDRVRAEPGAAAPQLSIQAIWAGHGAYVIGGDGEKYGLGATMPGGWKVEEIARAQVVVSRAGERVALVP